jgi:hypothetical protein
MTIGLINNEAAWIEVDCVGETTGYRYTGRFLVKPFVSIKEQAEAVRDGEALARGIEYDGFMRLLLQNCTVVNRHVVETQAQWWSKQAWENLLDDTPINELAKKIKELRQERTIKQPDQEAQ